MKVVDRKEFLAMPAGTLYTKFKPCYTDGLAIKHDTLDNGDDWFYTELIASTVEDNGDIKLDNGEELPFSADWIGRDGAFDPEQMFIVYSPADVIAFAETLAKLVNAGENCVSECAYREKVTELQSELALEKANAEQRRKEISLDAKEITELQDENKRLRRGIRRILEVKRLWSSVVGTKYKKMLTEIFSIAKQILD